MYTHETIKNIEQIFILYFISGIFIKIFPPTPVQLKPDSKWQYTWKPTCVSAHISGFIHA